MYGQLTGTGLQLGTDGLISGVPTLTGSLTFVAEVQDSAGRAGQKQFTLEIHEAVAIITDSVPTGRQGVAYQCPLESSGGTGGCTWTDRDGDLAGSGLSLSSAGVLSGTPVDTGMISFTARAEDAAGSADEKPLTLRVGPDYICGDADNSGGPANVTDLTYLVNYLFKEGPAPVIPSAGDADGDGNLNVADLTYLVDYLFKGGPPPLCEGR